MRNPSRKFRFSVFMFFVSCCLISLHLPAYAADQSETGAASQAEIQEKTLPEQSWIPPEPSPDEFDWIQLNSGEWLKGTLKTLYDGVLVFDSDELGQMELDWEDVKQFRGHRLYSARFEGAITVDGQLRITEDAVLITIGEESKKLDRGNLLAIAPRESREINYWSGKLSLGMTFTSGNTEQTQFNTIAELNRHTSSTRFVNDYLGNYSRTGGEDTINNHRLSSYFDVFRTRQYYLRPVFGEYYRDPIKNIAHRVTLGTGLGYHIIYKPKTTWDVSGGPAYQWTKFESVEEGEDSSESTPVLAAGTHFNTSLNKHVDFDFVYNLQLVNERSGSYNHHLVAAIETEITSYLDFDVSFVWDRTQTPQADADGTVPEQDDYYVIFSVGIDF